MFGVHYDTVENKFDFESVNPDNPFNEDDGKRVYDRVHLVTLYCILSDILGNDPLAIRSSFR